MAKKKINRHRKNGNKQYLNMSPEKLIELGDCDMRSGHARSAIMHYKQALKNQGNPSIINNLMFKAYLLREKQLSEKGMVKEAEAIKRNALEFKPKAADLTLEQLGMCLDAFPLKESIIFYNESFAEGISSPSTDKILVNKILLSKNTELLTFIHEKSPLMSHRTEVLSAVDAMNKGEWEKALEELKSVPRMSPWADVKMFCKAMVCFLRDDDKALARTLSQLSDASLFPSTRRTLKQYSESDGWDFITDQPEMVHALFEGDLRIYPQLNALATLYEQKAVAEAKPLILSVAEKLCPTDPMEAARSLLDILWQYCRMTSESPHPYGKLTRQMFPKKREASLVLTKAMFNYGPDFVGAVHQLYHRLGEIFTGKQQIAIAKSELLTHLASRLQGDRQLLLHPYLVDFAEMAGAGTAFACNNFAELCFSLVEHAVSVDPLNRRAYELADAFVTHEISNKRLETLYDQMRTRFPDDPYPCLKLADIYDRKNAYRKSENILKEALKRSPHDNRVLERYAFSFVISAEKNMRSGKLHLVRTDLSKAEAFNLPCHAEIIAEKKMLLESLGSDKTAPESLLAGCGIRLTFVQRLRVLALLTHDMADKGLKTTSMAAFFKKELKNILKQLTSMERADLLMPLGKTYAIALSPFNMAAPFLFHGKAFLDKIDDDHYIILLSTPGVIDRKQMGLFKKSLEKRIKKSAATTKPLFEFALAAFQYAEGDEAIAEDLAEMIHDAPPETFGRLKAISSALALLARGVTREDLELCNFTPFDPDEMIPDFFDFDSPSEDLFETDEVMPTGWKPEEVIQNMLMYIMKLENIGKFSSRSDIVRMIERTNQLGDMLGFNIMPWKMIHTCREELLEMTPPLRGLLANLESCLDKGQIALLSTGGYALLIGKRKS